MNRQFSKENIQVVNGHMKRYSTLLIIRALQIKTTVRYHFTPVRMAIIKKNTNNKCWWDSGEKETIVHCWWECKWVLILWKTIWRFHKKLKIELPHDPEIPLLGIFLKNNNNNKSSNLEKKIHEPQCSLNHYLQLPKYWSNPSVHQQMNG